MSQKMGKPVDECKQICRKHHFQIKSMCNGCYLSNRNEEAKNNNIHPTVKSGMILYDYIIIILFCSLQNNG